MHAIKHVLVPAAIASAFLIVGPPKSQAQVSISIGPEPACPFGYFDYAPYNCAPDGYYASNWFSAGVFIGAGPWFRGPAAFHGKVNNRFDPQHGYTGALPPHGAPTHPANFKGFKGNEVRDGRGHVAR
jgi:hypothetical protein